ncbi:MAG: hypothetical protein HZA15_13400 [Nitrospirae bacterium]|nr:hypothetical protein [Nitrospirota bacterium]
MKLKAWVIKLLCIIYNPKVMLIMLLLWGIPQIVELLLSGAPAETFLWAVAKLSLIVAASLWSTGWFHSRLKHFSNELEELSRKEEAEARREAEIVNGFRKK